MPKAGITPTCRYGHGDLKRPTQDVDGSPVHYKAYALPGLDYIDFNGKQALAMGNGGLVVEVFECPTCGYTELFETDVK